MRRQLETERSSSESDHQLAVSEYRLRVEELSVELRTLQVVVAELRGCSDDAARLTLELEREKGRLAGLCKSNLIVITSPQSHLRKARRSSADKKSSKLLEPHSPIKSRSSTAPVPCAAAKTWRRPGGHRQMTAAVFVLVRFCTWISLQPPFRY